MSVFVTFNVKCRPTFNSTYVHYRIFQVSFAQKDELITNIYANSCICVQVVGQALVEQDFTPVVTATCKAGFMTIKLATNQSFVGKYHCINSYSLYISIRSQKLKLKLNKK